MARKLTQKQITLWQKGLKNKADNLPNGYTLVEVLVVVSIIGILSALGSVTKAWYENPLGNSRDQMVGILKAVRLKAMSTTATYRVRPDPANPSQKLKVELTKSGSCDASTTLATDATATTQILTVNSVDGFSVGDRIQVGSDAANNNITAINADAQVINLGQSLGTDQSIDASVVMLKDWVNESIFLAEDLTFPEDITTVGKNVSTSQEINWALCVNSRGFVTLFDASTAVNANLELTLTNSRTSEAQKITVYQGGAIDAP